MPRWVKGFVIAGLVLVALVAVMLLAGHGPGRHGHHALPTPAADAVRSR
ncbi:hypothetical protein AB0M54_00305 [Actinoplanes sp. NPDC051470]